MAVKSPYEDLAEVKTMAQAQRLYKKLGRYLSRDVAGAGVHVRRAVDTKLWRDEAKEVRRILEERFGDTVRLTSATIYATAAAGEEGKARRVEPTWSRRQHFTVQKPKRGSLGEPYVLHIPLDDTTYEPLGAFADLSSAFRAAAELRRARKVIPPGVTYRGAEVALLEERLRAVNSALGPLEREVGLLKREKRRLEKDISRATRREQDLRGKKGAGPD